MTAAPAITASRLRSADSARVGAGQWLALAALAALFALLFRFNLHRIWQRTNPFTGEADWTFAMFVPIASLLYLYLHRQRLAGLPARPAWSGLPIALFGLFAFALGIWPERSNLLQDMGMLLSLWGFSLLLLGWQRMRVAAFPLAFLVCAIPWPGKLYNLVAFPMQKGAVGISSCILQLAGINAYHAGTKIFVDQPDGTVRAFNVVEACAGLRSLTTFITVAAAVAFFFPRKGWQRVVILAAAVPVAIACNVFRIAGQGLLDQYVSQKLSEGFYHQFVGAVMLAPGFLLILLVAWITENLFIPAKQPMPAAASPAAPSTRAKRPAASLTFACTLAIAILAIAAAGVNVAASRLELFQKLPVALAKPLTTLPARLGPWQQISIDKPAAEDLQEGLGTSEYIFRDYVDTRKVALPANLSTLAQADRDALLASLIADHPDALVNIAVTYYTGNIDRVSHVPDVCYVADGYRVSTFDVVQWPVDGKTLELRYLQFHDQSDNGKLTRNVAYFFHVNGRTQSDPWAVGRRESLFSRHLYFAKIEMMNVLDDRSAAAKVMQDFISYAYPPIAQCMPDWQKVEGEDQR